MAAIAERRKFILAAFGLLLGFVLSASTASTNASERFVTISEPLPAGAIVQTVLSGLNAPVAMAFDPQGRLFLTELTGAVRLYANGTLQAAPVITFTGDNLTGCIDRRLLGIAIDPNFNANHYIYVYLTDPSECEVAENKVIRFVESNGTGSNPAVIFSSPQTAGIDQGGNIHFGPDGKLYVSIGHDDNAATAQDVTVKPGKVHRINSDGTIPSDNPVFTPTGALPSLYAIGLRNSFDFTFDDVAGTRLFASENGPDCDDELNRVVGGYNYGWRPNYPCDDANPDPTYNTIPPMWHTEGASVAPTGIEVYTGANIQPWQNGLFICSYNDGVLRHFYLSADRTQVTSVADVQGVTCNMDLETGPDGALYYIEGGGYSPGDLKRIIVSPGPTATPIPTPLACNAMSGSIITSPNVIQDANSLKAVAAVSANDVWAVGSVGFQALIEHWDGTAWTVYSVPTYGALNAVAALSANDVWAVGEAPMGQGTYSHTGPGHVTLTMHWDGQEWSTIPSPTLNEPYLHERLLGVAGTSANNVWAVGSYQRTYETVTLIMHWDGTQWATVSSPNPGDDFSSLADVTAISANDAWAVGSYSSANTIRIIALHWNGVDWSIVPVSAVGNYNSFTEVDAVATDDVWAVGTAGINRTTVWHWNGNQWSLVYGPSELYAGFFSLDAVAADDVWVLGWPGYGGNEVLHWDGTQWNSSMTSNIGLIDIAALPGSDVWAVGSSSPLTRVEHLSDGEWRSVPSPNSVAIKNYIASVDVVSEQDAWAVGEYVATDGLAKGLALHWDGAAWTQVGDVGSLSDVDALSSSDVWAVGYSRPGFLYPQVRRWDGATWTTILAPFISEAESVYLTSVAAVSTNDVWVAGYYVPRGNPDQTVTVIMHWNGSELSIVPNPTTSSTNRLDEIAAIAADDIWAVGRDNDHTLTMHWNGVEWTIVPSPNVGTSRNILHGLSAASTNSVWAVGYYGPSSTGQTLVLRWDGTQWSVVPSANVGDNSFLLSVDALADNDVWAVGNYYSGGIQRTLVEHWDGSAWSVVSSPNANAENNYLNGVKAVSANQVWAVGGYTEGYLERTLIQQFTRSSTQIFSDVPPDNTFYPFVQCIACQGIISGYSDGTFRPGNDVTRGQLSKIVSNSAGFNEPPGGQLFEDVLPGSTFYDWVQRLANRGYIGGYPCGGPGEPCGSGNLPYFRPNANATRGQISKIVSNAAGYNDTPPGQTFEDVPTSNTFYLWIERLASRGIMGGYPCGSEGEPCGPGNKPYFRWMNNATRGQTSKIVANTFFPNCQVAAKP
ncbi:MAG TPA: PQQ-dependent sugar dehydrogenase [Chloroflexia bacterium]|nr:PQQ-dependent sugar dehydrogenase [Chloroflexia bacterium]